MPILDVDPCSVLNTGEFPLLWTATGYNDVATNGSPTTYKSVLTKYASSSKRILRTPDKTSKVALTQFLSGAGVAAATKVDYSLFKNIWLGTSTAAKGLVDDYFNKGAAYTYSTTDHPIVSNADIAGVQAALVADGTLLSQDELFTPSQFQPSNPASPPSSGTECLVYLYELAQSGNYTLTSSQLARKNTLEAKNLRFFGAFIAEYCFYRSRYQFLLTKYFDVYKMQASGSGVGGSYNSRNIGGPSDPVMALFNGAGTGDNQYMDASGSRISQSDYLKGIAYHMACLNTRMTDLRRLLGQISTYYSGVYTAIQQAINNGHIVGSNADLTEKVTALSESAEDTSAYLQQQDFHQGIMEYTLEKNRYSNILLGLYAFLNIAAVAMVIHLNR